MLHCRLQIMALGIGYEVLGLGSPTPHSSSRIPNLQYPVPSLLHQLLPNGVQQPQAGDLGDLAERGVDLLYARVFQPSGEMF